MIRSEVSYVGLSRCMLHLTDMALAAQMRYVREAGMVGHDLYWISMLYDKEWVPLPND